MCDKTKSRLCLTKVCPCGHLCLCIVCNAIAHFWFSETPVRLMKLKLYNLLFAIEYFHSPVKFLVNKFYTSILDQVFMRESLNSIASPSI